MRAHLVLTFILTIVGSINSLANTSLHEAQQVVPASKVAIEEITTVDLNSINLFVRFGLTMTASASEISERYKELVDLYISPYPVLSEEGAKIHSAYNTLSNEEFRIAYIETLATETLSPRKHKESIDTSSLYKQKKKPKVRPEIKPEDLVQFKSLDYYVILGVARNATSKEIKTAYRSLSTKFHPDKNPGVSDGIFKIIGEAYDTLSDVGKRQAYDYSYNYVKPTTHATHTTQADFAITIKDILKRSANYMQVVREIQKITGDALFNGLWNKFVRHNFIIASHSQLNPVSILSGIFVYSAINSYIEYQNAITLFAPVAWLAYLKLASLVPTSANQIDYKGALRDALNSLELFVPNTTDLHKGIFIYDLLEATLFDYTGKMTLVPSKWLKAKHYLRAVKENPNIGAGWMYRYLESEEFSENDKLLFKLMRFNKIYWRKAFRILNDHHSKNLNKMSPVFQRKFEKLKRKAWFFGNTTPGATCPFIFM